MDKYLWAVRVFKTRSDAADAVRTNKVTVNGAYAKPSREVKIGDVIAVRKMQVTYSYKVLDLVSSRQPAKNVPLYCLNVTPQEELDKLNVPRETIFIVRDRGTGRPTKKERRRSITTRRNKRRIPAGAQSRLFPEEFEEKKKASCRVLFSAESGRSAQNERAAPNPGI